MSSPYIGEIRMFGGNFAPLNWAFCNGQVMAIADNDALFSLIGTTFGGDGVTTFSLPDLRCRLPLHQGNNQGAPFIIGQTGGEETHTLNLQQLPSHSHAVSAKTTATSNSPSGNLYAGGGVAAFKAAPGSFMNGGVVVANAGGQPHENMMPFLAVSFIIALFGVYPSQS